MAKRILIADDSVTIQKAFAMTFAGEDLALVAARSADEGLSMAQRARPDLVVADGVMPGRSGYDLCTAIKSDPGLRGVPVYILASSQNPFDEVRARQCAADGHFTKPFDSNAIVMAVADALAKGAGAAAVAPAAAPSFPAPSPAAPPPALVDDYGEISVGGSGIRPGAAVSPGWRGAEDEITPPPSGPTRPAVSAPAPVSPTPPAPMAAPVMRPSLIPGMRPGLPGTRPGAAPARPASTSAPQPMPLRPSSGPPSAPTMASGTRTMMGLPAGGLQPPPRTSAPSFPVQPAPVPASPVRAVPPVESRTPPPALASSAAAQAVSAVSTRVAAQMASISARGPEYEAIAKLSREIIEKIAWEIVPELAETIIREELQKRGRV